jgi:hypothetical protein
MAQQTEAACLLESGATYGKRLLLRPESGDPIFAGFRQGAFSLYFGDAPIYHLDRDGRWQRTFAAGTHYLKGLDATVQAIDRVRQGGSLVLRRRTLGRDEASDLDAQVRAAALGVLDSLDAGRLAPLAPATPTRALSLDELREDLVRVASWDATAWALHRERYLATYAPLPFIPPDAQGALVVQATTGHARGVAFGLGVSLEHRVRTPRELGEHAADVRRLFGRSLEQCRSVFLAGGDALRQPPEVIAAYLETLASAFPIGRAPGRRGGEDAAVPTPRLEGIDAFVEEFAPPRPDRHAWSRFRTLHLRRVSLGVESGDPGVRTLYRKDWRNEDLLSMVADLKDAGLGVGVLALADAGGVEHADRHLAATAELINAMPLGPGDLVLLLDGSEFVDPALGPGDLGFTPLGHPRRAEQQAELRRLLLPVRTEKKAKVAPYSLEKQGLASP